MKIEDKDIVKKVIRLFKPFTKKIIIIVICIVLSSALSVITPLINKELVDNGLMIGNINVVIGNSILSVIIVIIVQALEMVQNKYRVYIESMLSYNLEKDAFSQTLRLKMEFFNKTNYAEIMSNLGLDIGNISEIANANTFYMVTSIFRIIVGVIGLFIINWKLSILVLVIIPLRYLIVEFLTKIRKSLVETYMNNYKDYAAWYGDTIGGIKEVKIFGLENIKIQDFIKKQRNIIKTNIKMSYINKINETSEDIAIEVITYLLYIIGAYMIIDNKITIGGLFAFLTYSSYVTTPISSILNIRYYFANILPSAKRYFDFMDMENEVSDKEGELENINKYEIIGNIRFENVNFAYKQGVNILDNINFEIKAKEKVAIIGTNGSGKTTIINLIMRFIKVDSGRVLIDGQDINSFNIQEYRALLSMVNQDIYLFNMSVKDNIMQGVRKSDELLKSASKKSGAHEFIKHMKYKYESVVGQRGLNLSGGERQKIAMARAFARDSKIMILDEATSNYDIESENYVNMMLEKYFSDRTIIIVTHRAEMLKKVDKIIVLKDGVVEGIGTHSQLKDKNEFYRQLIKNSRKEEKI